VIKDDALADAAEAIENSDASAAQSRHAIGEQIRARYTAPAK
jgi:hypothetical protein